MGPIIFVLKMFWSNESAVRENCAPLKFVLESFGLNRIRYGNFGFQSSSFWKCLGPIKSAVKENWGHSNSFWKTLGSIEIGRMFDGMMANPFRFASCTQIRWRLRWIFRDHEVCNNTPRKSGSRFHVHPPLLCELRRGRRFTVGKGLIMNTLDESYCHCPVHPLGENWRQ